MATDRIIELLTRKMAGEASRDELEELGRLLSANPDAVYYEEILKQVWQHTPAEPDEVPDPEQQYLLHQLKYKDDFAAADHSAAIPYHDPFDNSISFVIGILMVLLIVFAYWNVRDKSHPDTRIVAGKGMRKKIRLPDGTLVWLNAESKLSYAADFYKKQTRRVYLSGEAFFDVAHHADRPFIVRTDKISVRVLGTAFNVQAYPRDHRSEATLLRGSIELSVNDKSGQKVILSPSEKFAFIDNTHHRTHKKKLRPQQDREITMMIDHVIPVRIGEKEYIEETSWKDNRLVFHNESLAELKPRLERWFNVQIHLESSLSSSYRFTGVFTKETINEALAAMQLIKPFTFKRNAHDVTIY